MWINWHKINVFLLKIPPVISPHSMWNMPYIVSSQLRHSFKDGPKNSTKSPFSFHKKKTIKLMHSLFISSSHKHTHTQPRGNKTCNESMLQIIMWNSTAIHYICKYLRAKKKKSGFFPPLQYQSISARGRGGKKSLKKPTVPINNEKHDSEECLIWFSPSGFKAESTKSHKK